MNYRWNWGILLQDPYWGWLWSGLEWTLLISLGSWIIALVIGVTFGIARSLPNRAVQTAAGIYVEIFRNIPPLVQLFLWYFVFPEVVPDTIGLWIKRDLPQIIMSNPRGMRKPQWPKDRSGSRAPSA